MKIAYFDGFAGASGDMILGALVDAGLSLDYLRQELAKLKLAGYELQSRPVVKGGLGGTQVLVLLTGSGGTDRTTTPLAPHHHHHQAHHESHHYHHHHHHHETPGHQHGDLRPHQHHAAAWHYQQPQEGELSPGQTERPHEHRHLTDIRQLLAASDLSPTVKEKSLAIFTRLAEAEAKVHRTSVERIHFHEVGATDAIVDIVGAVIGLEALGVEKVYCSPLQVGGGTVKCAHGVLPVPAPATLELMRGYPIYASGIQGELLTPTGAAILTTLAAGFGPLPAMTVEAVGYGAGSLDLPIPNLLRVTIGQEALSARGQLAETVAVLETNIDDMNPQLYDYLLQRLLALGALDVFITPIQMKKNRPGVLLTVICPPAQVDTCATFLWRESTTIGLRWRLEHRYKLARETRLATTRFGQIGFKVSYFEGRPVQVTPEYDDCKRAAEEQGIPLLQVLEEARALALELLQAETSPAVTSGYQAPAGD